MENSLKLYHNPNCSKSRAALALLEENDFDVDIVYYLDNPPAKEEIRALAEKLALPLRKILRKSEAAYEQFNLNDKDLNEEIVLDIVAKHPILIERPILQIGEKAVIGRPPERVIEFAKGFNNE